MSTDERYLKANQAGQAATLATVQAVTGQKIDHFAEVNLAGFYYLAAAFGGIEACIKPENGGRTSRRQLRLQRVPRRLQPDQGRGPVPAPQRAAGAGVRP